MGVFRSTPLIRATLMGPVLASTACIEDVASPDEVRVEVVVAAGDAQFGIPGNVLAEPLQVVVTDPLTGRPEDDVVVDWRIVEGAGASVTPGSSRTDAEGIATTQFRLGTQTGVYRVEAHARFMIGSPASFTARAVLAPAIGSIQPAGATAGQTVTINGNNFSPVAEENAVLFGGLKGTVLSADPTRLTVNVPRCVPTRSVDVRVLIGAVASGAVSFQATAASVPPLQLARGEARLFTDPADLSCLRLPTQAGTTFLVIPHNAAQAPGFAMPFELRAIVGGGVITAPEPLVASQGARPFNASDWELALRARERQLQRDQPDALLRPQVAPLQVQPEIGERRNFNVLTADNESVEITAEVKAISARAIMYQDLDAPANGFTTADFDLFGSIFDDPIYPTDVQVFGQPSDVDANGKIMILFTPKVNALTPRDENSFIAGYFYGCDLVAVSRCADSNRAEIFYSMVPDPDGRFSGRRTKTTVLRTVPGILAHEFQHMIHFARKNDSLDELWLSEGLAHAAEDIVGDVFAARGDTARAIDFKLPNFSRAHLYLGKIAETGLIVGAAPGTLELRGGGWLFTKYVMGHYGGQALLGRLTTSPRSGVANVTAETGQAWSTLLSQFAVAVWADGAPELQGATLAPRLTFPDFDVRRLLGQFQGGFALRPRTFGHTDFLVTGSLPSASQDYLFIDAPTGSAPSPLSITLTGIRGGSFTGLNAAGQLTLFRVR